VSNRLLYPRTDWSTKDWQLVQVMPSHRLLDDRLRVQGVQAEDISAYQSWAHRLANHVILDDDEARQYYSMELEDWVASRDAAFWRKHHLPDDPALYDEFYFLDFIQARKQLLKIYLQSVLTDEMPKAEAQLQNETVTADAHAEPVNETLGE
jgi:hypothetical protein